MSELIARNIPWRPKELNVGPPAKLVLRDGTEFYGYSFGYEDLESENPEHLDSTGEVVFSTSMLGYAEVVTDPNYAGKILVLTYPEIGNIGVPSKSLDEYGLPVSSESDHTYLRGMVVCNNTVKPSHWQCAETFSEYLKRKKVVAMGGVDTRALTKYLRTKGATLGRIVVGESVGWPTSEHLLREAAFFDPNKARVEELVHKPEVRLYTFHSKSREAAVMDHDRVVVRYKFQLHELNLVMELVKKVNFHKMFADHVDFTHGDLGSLDKGDESNRGRVNGFNHANVDGAGHPREEDLKLLLVLDVGMKNSILRSLLNNCPSNVRVLVVPNDFDLSSVNYDGLFISNGPGNPNNYKEVVENVRKCLNRPSPIFGICLGNLLLGMAGGYRCVKMVHGNHGANQPCIDLRTFKCYATTQSHIYQLVPPETRDGHNNNQSATRWGTLFENANDNSMEGVVNLQRPFFGVQFLPVSNPTFRQLDYDDERDINWNYNDLDTSFLYRDFFTCLLKRTLIPIHIRTMSAHIRCKRILLLSSGGLSIGQAGEFDYSGSQAIKALKESDAKIILINPNIATVQTSKGMAHVTYFLPITFEYVKQIIEKEKPDGIMCSFGGQTGLNVGIELYEKKVLQENNCEILGTSIKTIIETEDRYLFNKKMSEIGERCAPSRECKSVEECLEVAKALGYPVLVRGNFELGGFGSGFADNEVELSDIVTRLFGSNRCKTSIKDVCVHIDKSLKGWKEIEFEILRDNNDNCVCAASMENFDPLGVHTGDSIVVAPAQTLSAAECGHLKQVGFKVVRHLNLVGECNIQFAVNPHKFEYFIVELNARLSRSSALASKATGYPLAYMAAKIALGYDLVQMRNSITLSTTACFEPSLDYVVVKMPRWDLRKFEYAYDTLGSSMKSVGEVMGIGRTFEETMQKALRMASESVLGFEPYTCKGMELEKVKGLLERPTPDRVHAIYRAYELGMTPKEVNALTWIDEWFLDRLHDVYRSSKELESLRLEELSHSQLLYYKTQGFSDRQLAFLLDRAHGEEAPRDRDAKALLEKEKELRVRAHRLALGITPKVKIIDTLAGEYPVVTNYCYLTYNSVENDLEPVKAHGPSISPSVSVQNLTLRDYKRDDETPASSTVGHYKSPAPLPKSSIIVLGCGPYRIGSSIEFDWSAVGCIKTLRKVGHSAIIVNCNPETVSTDFDVSDRLYFEELSIEIVDEIYRFENPLGIILSVGGQTANNLAIRLDELGLNILGTPVSSIDQCECRNKFSKICDLLGIDQPSWEEFTCVEAAKMFCDKVGFPVLARPSYVLSGASMRVITSHEELETYLQGSAVVNRTHPVVITKFIENAKEVEMDCVAKDGVIINYAISEHVENAGIHSGDATLILPAQNIFVDTHRRVKKITQKLSRYLHISGPFNVQFMCRNNKIKIIECNLRASRTLPFISTTFNVDFIELATMVMVGVPVRVHNIQLMEMEYVAVKMPLFSFDRLYPADPLLGVEMKSTGEIATFGQNKYEALLKAMTASGMKIPEKGVILSLGSAVNKFIFSRKIKGLLRLGIDVYATEGTYNYIKKIWESEKEFMTSTAEPDATAPEKEGGKLAFNEQLVSKLDTSTFDEFEFEITKLGEFKKINKPKSPRGWMPGHPFAKEGTREREGEENVYDLIDSNKVDMLINVSDSINSVHTTGGYMMRRASVDSKVSVITSTKLAVLVIDSLLFRRSRLSKGKEFTHVKSHQEYLAQLH